MKIQNLKRGILTLKGQFHTMTHQKELVSPIAVLKLKTYKKMSNYGKSYS